MPLPPYIKKKYKVTRTLKANWYLGSYTYKFNLSRTRVFLEGLKNHKLLGLKCRGCNTVSFPPTLICGHCLTKPDQWITLPETGSVSTGSAAYVEDPSTGQKKAVPVIAVKQDGADTCWVHNLPDNYSFEDVYIGMPLKVHWAPETKGLWMDVEYYVPIDDPAKEINKKEMEK